jgi:hypothetical protein
MYVSTLSVCFCVVHLTRRNCYRRVNVYVQLCVLMHACLWICMCTCMCAGMCMSVGVGV